MPPLGLSAQAGDATALSNRFIGQHHAPDDLVVVLHRVSEVQDELLKNSPPPVPSVTS